MTKPASRTQLVQVPPPGTTIQTAADTLVALIEQEREHAARNAEAKFLHLKNYMEQYRRHTENNQRIYESNSALYTKRILELEREVVELKNAKRSESDIWATVVRGLEVLEKARDCTEDAKPNAEMQETLRAQDHSSQPPLQSRLAEYGIYFNNDLLSLRDQWLPLFQELLCAEDTDSHTAPSEFLSPAKLNSLLSVFVDRIRKDRHTIAALTRTALTLRQECKCMDTLNNTEQNTPQKGFDPFYVDVEHPDRNDEEMNAGSSCAPQ